MLSSFSRFGLAFGFLGLAGAGVAAPSFFCLQNVKSGLLDTSNLYVSETNYTISFTQDSSDPTLYINGAGLSYGTWDPNIALSLNSSAIPFGTAFTGSQSLDFGSVLQHFGAVDGSVAPGFYDLTLDLYGGSTSSATNVLANIYIQFEVASSLTFDLTGVASPSVIQQGQSSTVSVTLNNTSGRDINTSSWGYIAGGMEFGSSSLSGNFVGDWFGKTIVNGDSRTDLHTTWDASPIQTTGIYNSSIALIGGYHPGDQHWMAVQNTTIEVTPVPEPATLSILGVALLGTLRRRRK